MHKNILLVSIISFGVFILYISTNRAVITAQIKPKTDSKIIQLTNDVDPTGNISPVFSPNGKYIAFASSRKVTYHIWVMDNDGKHPREISNLSWDMQPDWNPDGKTIVFASYGENRKKGVFNIWKINIDRTKLFQLTFDSDSNNDNQCPKWSPDGKNIVWTHSGQLWIMNKDGKDKKPLTTEPCKAFEYCLSWLYNK